ncbi:MAG TPA: hypothetical protein VNA25_17600 [Phycisphaerae bacterium]|nr:hypothetical protein [Phycisphaerae bacterium]
MAFAFFRRRQKMVIIIMAVLMVSFLIGFQGFQTLFAKKPGDRILGRTDQGEIRVRDTEMARADLDIVRMTGLADSRAPTSVEFTVLNRQENPALAYALLLQEAEKNKIRISRIDLDSFFARMGLADETYKDFLSSLRSASRISEKQLRAACARWLMIHRMYLASWVQCPPSELEVGYFCRDFYEKIDLRIVRFGAEKFMDAVQKDIDPNEFQQHFLRHRTKLAGQFEDENSFGFGYLVPNRVRIRYILIAQEVVARATRPSEEQVRKYYMDHRDEFVLKLPSTQSQPTTAGDDSPKPGEIRKTLADAKAEIIEKLSGPAVQSNLQLVVGKVRDLLAEYSMAKPMTMDAYQWVRSKMLRQAEADEILQRRISVAIEQQPLEDAAARLARVAQLEAICFPWGEHGELSLDPSIKVTVKGENITLAEALRQLGESAKWPAIQWGMCEGFKKALFPVGGPGAADFFPVTVKETPLLSAREMQKDDVLNYTAEPGVERSNVLLRAFTAEPFSGGQVREAMKVGDDGPMMTVWGRRPGLLLWRLTEAVGSRALDKLDDDVRKQVEQDILTQRAFDLAYQRAQTIKTLADFEAADANADFEAINTGTFARKNPMTGQYTSIGKLELPPNPAILKYFVDAAFALAPVDEQVPPIGLIRMPSTREVLVMRQIGYEPMTREDYELHYRPYMIQRLWQLSWEQSFMRWFSLQAIGQRVGFVAERR